MESGPSPAESPEVRTAILTNRAIIIWSAFLKSTENFLVFLFGARAATPYEPPISFFSPALPSLPRYPSAFLPNFTFSSITAPSSFYKFQPAPFSMI
jgi:hypothetical protein